MRVFNFGKKREFSTVAIDPSGRWVAAAGGHEPTAVWDMTTGDEITVSRKRGETSPAWQILFLLDGKLLITTGQGLYQFHPEEGGAKLVLAGGCMMDRIASEPANSWVVCSNRLQGQALLTALDRVGEPTQQMPWSVNMGDNINEQGYALHLACLGDGKRFLSAEDVLQHTPWHRRYRITIRSREDGRILNEAEGLFGPDDHVIATHVCDTFVVLRGIWLQAHHVDNLSAVSRTLRNDGRKHFTAAAFHPSGKYLAVTSNDTTVKLFDMRTWEVVRTFNWDIGRMRSIAFSPDGNLAVAGGDKGKIVVWDVDL